MAGPVTWQKVRTFLKDNAGVLIVLGAWGFLMAAFLLSVHEDHTIQRLRSWSDQHVYILADSTWGDQQRISYKVRHRGDVLVPKTAFYFRGRGEPTPEFRLAWGRHTRTVAIVDKSDPLTVLALYDHLSGESWPYAEPDETPAEVLKKRDRLFRRFQATPPQRDYRLTDGRGPTGAGQ